MLSAGLRARDPRRPAAAPSLIFRIFSRDPSPPSSKVRVDICSLCAAASPAVYPRESADTLCCQAQVFPVPRVPSVQVTIAH